RTGAHLRRMNGETCTKAVLFQDLRQQLQQIPGCGTALMVGVTKSGLTALLQPSFCLLVAAGATAMACSTTRARAATTGVSALSVLMRTT
ncbi:MAG: hypothetical protein LBQ74_20265, partial [Prevotella sp.]|nr:hypothetical protein [Prevotella sp.]